MYTPSNQTTTKTEYKFMHEKKIALIFFQFKYFKCSPSITKPKDIKYNNKNK